MEITKLTIRNNFYIKHTVECKNILPYILTTCHISLKLKINICSDIYLHSLIYLNSQLFLKKF